LEFGALTGRLVGPRLQAGGWFGAGLERYVCETFLLLESLALIGLGAALHWKRSFFGGSLAMVADVCLLLADPVRAMNTWYLVLAIGLAMVGLVVFIERYRQRIPAWVGDWRQWLEVWE
jgi:hypothetical protein